MGTVRYLLYDGHGSTRQLVNGTQAIDESYSYDAYGVMLSDNTASGAEAASGAGTSLLYSGEQYDGNLDQYYLRARYYNPANGLFNQVDPYAGNMQDPQSLHKYAYVHNNPVNAIDPTGMFSMPSMVTSMAISTVLTGIINIGITGKGFNNLAKAKFIPSGIILNVSFATQGTSWGLTAAGTLSLFYHFSSKSLNLLFTPEAGLAPISMFSTQRGLSVLFTAGFVFNADKATDVKGYSVTATWPRAMANFVVPSPFRATPYYYAMMSYCNYLTGRWPGRTAVIQISQSSNGSTVEFSAGQSYSFSSTIGHTYMPDMTQLPSKIRGVAQNISSMFSGLSLQSMETPDKLMQIQDSATSYLESN